jgi:hypothetical protein
MELIPRGRNRPAHVKAFFQRGQGASLGLLVLFVIPKQSLEFFAKQFADRRGLPGRKLPRLPDQVPVKTESDVLFGHLSILAFDVFHVIYV